MKTNSAPNLHAEMVAALNERTGLRPEIAILFVDAIMDRLQARYGSECLYIPSRRRVYPLDAMKHALQAGEKYRTVAKRHGIPHRTLYRLLPRKVILAAPGGSL